MRFRTSLARVRGLGAARSGTEHWWLERLTSAAGLPLTIFLIWLALRVGGRSHQEVASVLGHPFVAIGLLLSLTTLIWHMKLGMQVIIEDYVHDGSKFWLLVANNFFVATLWVAGLHAVLRLSLGAL
jgi:succinate dehydrogenase / fumarate reductase membrane anchor subunit